VDWFTKDQLKAGTAEDGMNLSEWPCVVCGAPLKRGHRWINFDNVTGEYLAPDARPAHGEFGLQGIGDGCAKKLVSQGKIQRSWIIAG
jgi:hypothetical protein